MIFAWQVWKKFKIHNNFSQRSTLFNFICYLVRIFLDQAFQLIPFMLEKLMIWLFFLLIIDYLSISLITHLNINSIAFI